MAASRLDSAWSSYRTAIDDFYAVARPALDDAGLLDEAGIDAADDALDTAASASGEVREACVELLEGRSNRDEDEVALLLLAAGALDSMLASDGLQLAPQGLGRDERFTEGAGLAEREAEPRDEIIAAATYVYEGYLGISGAADPTDGPQLRGVCLGTVDTLLSAATKPALRFTFYGFTAPLTSFAAETVNTVTGLSNVAGRIVRHALRLLAEALGKIVAIVLHEAVEKAIEWVFEPITGVLSNAGAAILGRVARRENAERRITESINAPPDWIAGQLASVNLKVNQLTGAYVDQMKWAGRIAGWIARATPFVSVLAGPAGVGTVTGVNAIGLGFVAYSVTVRVGSRGVPHPREMVGVVAIVDGR